MSADPDLLAVWTRGWALTRGVGAPVWEDGGWRIEVGAEDQVRRFVFSDLGPAVGRCAQAIDQPAVLLKVCSEPEAVRAVLQDHWNVAQTGWMMRLAGRMPPSRPTASGYAVHLHREGEVAICVLLDSAGDGAARGRAVKVGEHVIYDRIRVEPAHQRRGLGGLLMRTLEAETGCSGLGLLVATDAGRALYETLGWTVQSPYTTAVIV